MTHVHFFLSGTPTSNLISQPHLSPPCTNVYSHSCTHALMYSCKHTFTHKLMYSCTHVLMYLMYSCTHVLESCTHVLMYLFSCNIKKPSSKGQYSVLPLGSDIIQLNEIYFTFVIASITYTISHNWLSRDINACVNLSDEHIWRSHRSACHDT